MTLLLCAFIAWTGIARATQAEVPVIPTKDAVDALPYMEWLLDPTRKIDVDAASSVSHQSQYRPLQVRALPNEYGTFWIRIVLAPRPAEVSSMPAAPPPSLLPLLLDLGNSIPGVPVLYIRANTHTDAKAPWKELAVDAGMGTRVGRGAIFVLPEPRLEPQTVYLRLDAPPGIGFAPTFRTPHNAATALERLAYPALLAALAMVMLLCLVRGLTERGEWRLWTSAFVAVALTSAALGIPVMGKLSVQQLAATLTPGMALMLLAHVGRHLLRTRQTSRVLDIQYILLSLPGACLAVLPLAPGYAWTARYLDLWPAGIVLFIPTTIGAWLCGLPGARRFLLGCLLPCIGAAVAWIGLPPHISPAFVSTLPLWGLTLGALIIAGTGTPQEYVATPAQSPTTTPVSPQSPQDMIKDDPNLRIVATDDAYSPEDAPVPIRSDAHALALEETLRIPMDTLLRDGAALEQCALPPAARQLCQSMLETVRGMAAAISGTLLPLSASPRTGVFDLQEGLRHAHDAVSLAAEAKNIALSWFMPPHLPHRYRGNGAHIIDVLHMLLESAVRATSRGVVHMAVRRMPESVHPGHLLLSVSDTGTGMPPEERSSIALVRAWELAAAHRGFLGVESGPHGVTISFTMYLDVADHEHTVPAEQDAGILLVDDSSSNRQLWAFFLEGLPYRVAEARSLQEAADLHEHSPARLHIIDADMPVDFAVAITRLREHEATHKTPPAILLALTSDASTEHLYEAGFTHILPKPITRARLRETVSSIFVDALVPDSKTLVAVSDSLHMGKDDANIVDTGAPLHTPALEHTHTGTDFMSMHMDTDTVWVGEPMPIVKVPADTPPEPMAPESFVPLVLEPSVPEPAPAPTKEQRASLIPPSMQLMEFILPEQPLAQPSPPISPPTSPKITRPVAPATLSLAPPTETPRMYTNVGEPMPILRPHTTDGQMPLETLLESFDQSVVHARQAYAQSDAEAVRHAARYIALHADSFGLRALARMARCVEDAAKADDKDALGNLLPELESFVERNKIAMRNR